MKKLSSFMALFLSVPSAFAHIEIPYNYPTKTTVSFVVNCINALTPELFRTGNLTPSHAAFVAGETCVCVFDNVRGKYTHDEFLTKQTENTFTQQEVIDCLPNGLGGRWSSL